MALEVQEIVQVKSRNSTNNVSGEEPALQNQSSCVSQAISRLNNIRTQKKLNVRDFPHVLTTKAALLTGDSRGSGDSGRNGRSSITDLPAALVSEILRCLDPKELGIVSCVSTILHTLASGHYGWQEFYCKRWGPPLGTSIRAGSDLPSERTWKELYVEREMRSKSFMGRYSIDALRGHTEAVRAVCMLQYANLILTGGYDGIVRMWDMEDGLSIAASQPLGCTIRAIAADSKLLVAGGTNAFLQCWRAIEGNPHLFDIAGSAVNQDGDFRLWGHEGPITCLGLTSTRIFSGSWDMSIRVWDRSSLKCIKILRHGDWVWNLVPRGAGVVSTAGRGIYIWDISNGNLMDVIHDAHVSNAYALACSYSGDLVFTGGDDGDIHMYKVINDSDGVKIEPCAIWKPHTTTVQSLAFEFPWLVSCSSDGRLALIDVRKLMKPDGLPLASYSSPNFEPPQRMLHGLGHSLYAVAIGADRIISGGEEGVVQVWNFSQALEIEERVRALRGIRLENRMRRRRIQIEMNGRSGVADQNLGAAKRNQLNGNRSGPWHGKRRDQKS
ncbi:F-box/WD-40 repeat-containing protein [Apostasia shenzhenica]|uniref:F-box/WD-40 repeat-containing protein n=1 Tax=Apostasia shenzhenica TaxID=1088818 RepID=A0A2I0B227_9ASPA|nr:F-box/WD-40 repeat-containing protein [Apostasia shenzhenica]